MFGREVVDLARDLAIDVAGVARQHTVRSSLPGPVPRRGRGEGAFGAVEEPQLAGDGPALEEVGADADHHVHAAGLDDLPAYSLSPCPALEAWEDMTKPAGAALRVQVAPEETLRRLSRKNPPPGGGPERLRFGAGLGPPAER